MDKNFPRNLAQLAEIVTPLDDKSLTQTDTFSKTTFATNADEKGKAWFLSDEGRTISQVIGYVGVDPRWAEYFSHVRK